MKVISYSLFEPKKLYEHRFWDEDRMNEKRYWFNIPALLLINRVLYPEYKTFFYMDDNTFDSDISKLLVDLLGDFSFQIKRISDDYSGHEPALWRLKPLWDKDVDIFMSRDIDSIPNISEYAGFRFFENSSFTVHTIRSHPNHYGNPCRMLMGLSSFKPKMIPDELKTSCFDEFRAKYHVHNKWSTDQLTLINCFTSDSEFTSKNFLDTPINYQNVQQDFPCSKTSVSDLMSIEVSKEKRDIFNLVSEYGLSDWAGKPSDARNDFLIELCDILGYNKLLSKIEKSNLKEFYS